MAEEFEISCPKCEVIFSVPTELCGELAECSECSSVFEIPFPPIKAREETETGAIKGVEVKSSEVNATNTVKLSRTGIGMIPTLKEGFEFGTKAPFLPGQTQSPQPPFQKPIAPPSQSPVPQPAASRASQPSGATAQGMRFSQPPSPPPPPVPTIKQPPPPSLPPVSGGAMQQTRAGGMTFKKPPPTFKKPGTGTWPSSSISASESSQPQNKKSPAEVPPLSSNQRVSLPQWAGVKMYPDEEALACREVKNNMIGLVILISLPVLLCIPLPFLVNGIISTVIAGILWLATLITGFIIANGKARKVLILTSQRAIYIIGKNRIEIKK